jgi:hypothetical protein
MQLHIWGRRPSYAARQLSGTLAQIIRARHRLALHWRSHPLQRPLSVRGLACRDLQGGSGYHVKDGLNLFSDFGLTYPLSH